MEKKSRKKVCVMGLGFVGSAMSIAVASAKDKKGNPLYDVYGLDVNTEAGRRRIDSLNGGVFPFENNDENLQAALDEIHVRQNLTASYDTSLLKEADVVIVDINLDINYIDDKPKINMAPFCSAIESIGELIKADALIVIETTVPPGTCEKVVYPIIAEKFEKRGMDQNRIHIGHSYERVMPGKDYFNSIKNFWRVYSGRNDEDAELCRSFLETVISTDNYPLTRLSSTTSSETAKVLENSYRATNIAFMDEWGKFAEAVNIDLYEVIDAIRMRPTHSNIREPGFGVGGYCLTKDPLFAKLSAKELFHLDNMDFPFCTAAVEVNRTMPINSLNRLCSLLGDIQGKRLLVMGVSYRQDVGDTRYSPTEIFARKAIEKGAILEYHDPMVSYWEEMGIEVCQNTPDFSGFDAIIFAVSHKQYRDIRFKNSKFKRDAVVFDANHVLSMEQIEEIMSIKTVRFASIGR